MKVGFRISLSRWTAFTVVMGLLIASSVIASVAVTEPGGRRIRNNGGGDYNGVVGYDLLVGSVDAQVTHLGIWDGPGNAENPDDGKTGDGLEQPAVVGIYRVSDRTLVAEATVPAGDAGELEGEFRYANLEKPVTLSANEVYRIVAGYDRGGNAFHNYVGGNPAPRISEHFATGPDVYHQTRGAADQLIFPADMRTGSIYVGPNFRYTGGGPVASPEATEEANDRLTRAESLPGQLIVAEGFENVPNQALPKGWTIKPDTGSARLPFTIEAMGAGNVGQAMKIVPDRAMLRLNPFGGLAYRLADPADRIALAFDFKAVIGYAGVPALEVYSFGADSIEPTQLYLRISNNRIHLYGGIQLGWFEIPLPKRSGEQIVIGEPWYRIRLVIDREAEGIAVYLSPADSPEMPDTPIAVVPVNGIGESIAAIRFASAPRVNHCWIDNVTIHTGEEITAPADPELKPDLSEGFQFWTGDTFPRSFADVRHPEGIEHHVVYPATAPWRWYHGASIEAHNGKLYATWAANPHGENRPGEVVLVNESSDGGKTWSETKILADGDGKGGEEFSSSHGTLLSHDGKLWGFFQYWAGGWDNPLSLEGFILNEKTGEWESQGVVATQGWPMDRPKKTADGNWLMGVSGFKMQRPAVMISDGDDLRKWDTVAIPTGGEERRFPETSLIVDGNDVWSITRWFSDRAMVATSNDGGRTWTDAQRSNLPMGRSKPDSGILSTGQWYAVINMQDRNALMLVVGKPGENGFSSLYKVRYGSPPTEYPYKGWARPESYAYPYATEHDGKLYVVYSVLKADIEMAIIPIESLQAE